MFPINMRSPLSNAHSSTKPCHKGMHLTHQLDEPNLTQLKPMPWVGFYGLMGWVLGFSFKLGLGWVQVDKIFKPNNLTQSSY